MSQLEELKLFVAGRLRTATSEILGAIDKTIEMYEQEVTRLKEENKRHSSLLEIILKKKLPKRQGCHVTNTTTTEVAANLATDCSITPAVKEENSPSGPFALDSGVNSKNQTSTFSATVGQQTVFISKERLLRFSTMENCFFCFKQVPASKYHLMKRHYDIAVHFIQDEIERFVIPCMCSDKVQERSHWHCPCCEKVLNRRCIFKVHLSKQHCYTVLQTKQVSGNHRLPYTVTFEEESSDLDDSEEDEEELSSLEQQQETPSPLLQMKEKAAGQLVNVVDAQHSGSSQPQQHCLYLNQDRGMDICLNTRIQDGREVIVVESWQNNDFRKVLDSAGKMQHTNETGVVTKGKSCSNSKESIPTKSASSSSVDPSPPSKKHAKNQLAELNLSAGETEPSATQNRFGSYYCKACGEIFHYFHKLKAHVQKHAGDKICICGVCGKRLMRSESLHKHLQNHNTKNICGTCGKQFSNQSRLQQHKTFHKSKTKYKVYNMITPGFTQGFEKSKT
ncbi:neurotrophin receptor-interacting factor homolog [Poeciliopsis prolifica]|uniref:neurotrophin receptor-interacting factor homolog n=1 Tax=Poeciliopsis prolifica TaxID=188132 RepID=UPI002413F71C|nr:neurotrophin receptor-interacting factor homolog [Poeciliopsis prolifica]